MEEQSAEERRAGNGSATAFDDERLEEVLRVPRKEKSRVIQPIL